jgi:hypothetical protein
VLWRRDLLSRPAVELWTQLAGRPPVPDESEVRDDVVPPDALTLIGAVAFGAVDSGENELI